MQTPHQAPHSPGPKETSPALLLSPSEVVGRAEVVGRDGCLSFPSVFFLGKAEKPTSLGTASLTVARGPKKKMLPCPRARRIVCVSTYTLPHQRKSLCPREVAHKPLSVLAVKSILNCKRVRRTRCVLDTIGCWSAGAVFLHKDGLLPGSLSPGANSWATEAEGSSYALLLNAGCKKGRICAQLAKRERELLGTQPREGSPNQTAGKTMSRLDSSLSWAQPSSLGPHLSRKADREYTSFVRPFSWLL